MAILLFLVSTQLWAKPVVLVSYYDAFGKAPFNNSEKVAVELMQRTGKDSSFEIKLCALNTIFDKAYQQLENCLKSLDTPPVMVMGLGEAGRTLKLEMVTRNVDKTKGPDNAGIERDNTPIIPEGPQYLGMRLPLLQMYCAVSANERSAIEISNNAGSFVCNNTAYQLSYYYPDLPNGFIHVPANNSRNLERRNKLVVKQLEAMIGRGVAYLTDTFPESPGTPHSSNDLRWPITKNELNVFRKKSAEGTDQCEQEFFKRARGVDERGFWSFLKKR